jgi:hypothetical protein
LETPAALITNFVLSVIDATVAPFATPVPLTGIPTTSTAVLETVAVVFPTVVANPLNVPVVTDPP